MATIISLEKARGLVLEQDLQPTESISVDLLASLGRRLVEDVSAEDPWPTTDRSAMDGFALARDSESYASGARFKLIGESLAGHPYQGPLESGTAIRIMTGAVVPDAADRVVKVEDSNGFEAVELEIRASIAPGENIRPIGSEVSPGTLLIPAGTLIRSAEIGALAVLGVDRVSVHRPPRVAILATGDEVVPIDQRPAAHQLRDSNSYALAAKVLECGAEPRRIGIVGDRAEVLREALQSGLADSEVLLTIGGVSKGSHDLVHPTLQELGVAECFHGIALKPGKPSFFGHCQVGGRKRFVFGLPGNPASCVTVFDLLVRPLLAKMAGAIELRRWPKARLMTAGLRQNWRTQAVPCKIRSESQGELVAEPCRHSPSGNPFGMLAADGYALLEAETPLAGIAVVDFPSSWGAGS